ncbi:hypothetical protein M8J76_008536 [Diaphorina citri]|nr:hypothetical protein M8J76_008536 [Diaphorina citri]
MEEQYTLTKFLDITKPIKIKGEYLDDTEEVRTKSKRRTQKYRKAWESVPDFANWVKPVESDELSAQCILCSNIMKAEFTVLKRHLVSSKHVKNEIAAQSGSPVVEFKFKKEWEKHRNFKHWIARVEGNDKEACCTLCQVRINANISELKFHSRSEGHLKNILNTEEDSEPENEPEEEKDHKPKQHVSYILSRPDGTEIKDNEPMIEEYYYDETPKSHKQSLKSLRSSAVDFDHSVDIDSIRLTELRLEETVNEDVGDENSETPIRVFQVKPAGKVTSSSGSGTTSTKYQPIDEITPQAFVTQLAPQWKGKAVVNGHVQDLKLLDFRGRYVVMFFYPQDFSTVCSTEILALGDVLSAFRVINCEIIAVSVDSHLAHLAWTKTLTATSSNRSAIDPSKIVPLLSDSTHAISKTYGCYLSSAGHSLRAYYIIDKRGYLRSMNVSDIQVGRNLKEILRQVEAFQLVDSTDTQCPVNWTTGQPSVKVAL